jgi:two-component system response regulator HydG
MPLEVKSGIDYGGYFLLGLCLRWERWWFGMYKILVVDDQALTATYIQAVLRTRGMSATVCSTGEAALQAFRTEPYDLVLTDLRMEPMDGLGVVRELRAMGSQVPVVMMTGFKTLSSAGESLKLGVFDYVTKPLEVRELLKTVTRALALTQAKSGFIDLELIVPAHEVFEGIIAASAGMNRVIEEITRIADHDQPVFILGEEGVGRKLAAQAIHQRSRRRNMPFIMISEATRLEPNPKALETSLKEAGTIFVDEVTGVAMKVQEMLADILPAKPPAPADAQKAEAAKQPVQKAPPQVRLVASSVSEIPVGHMAQAIHGQLAARLAAGATIAVPPLRERTEDMVPMLYRLLKKERGQSAELPKVEMEVFDLFEHYAWPGNVSEFEDAVRCMASGEKDGCLRAESLPAVVRKGANIPGGRAGRNLDSEFLKGSSLVRFLREAGQRELMSRLAKGGESGEG